MSSDILFSTVEKFHAKVLESAGEIGSSSNRGFGRVLDAGTGVNSLRWINTLNTTSWVAITADNAMRSSILADHTVRIREGVDSLLVGNWMNEDFCAGLGKFDMILADYLIGAVDGFSPYTQDIILKRLKNHLNPQGRLYLIGMNPIPDHASGDGEIICEVRRARDAAILLSGHRPYREFPLDWITRHLQQEGIRIVKSKSFTILHSEESALRQLRVAQSKLDLMHAGAREGMSRYLFELAERVRDTLRAAGGKIPLSFDYVIAAEIFQDQLQLMTAAVTLVKENGDERAAELVDNA